MVRIKKKCISAVSHGDDHEHALLRGEYKYFTGKAIDVRGASVTDLIAFVQCCSFFKFYETGSLDRVLEELSLKVTTLQPLEVLALMVAVSDLPSKSLGLVDLDAVRQHLDERDDIASEIRKEGSLLLVKASQFPTVGGSASGQGIHKDGAYGMSRKDVASSSLFSSSAGGNSLEITNNKNFTDFRFRRFAVGSQGDAGRQAAVLEGSDRSAMTEASARAMRLKTEHTYHATLSASFFTELSAQALLFLGDGEGTPCQFSVEEQLEMLATLPEGADQDLVMALLDSLAAPLIHLDAYHKKSEHEGAVGLTPLIEQGSELHDLYNTMPWHAVTVAKGLLLVELETVSDLASAEAAMERGFKRFSNGGIADSADAPQVETLKKSVLYRRQKARDEMSERKQRNSGNALFIHKAAALLGGIVSDTAGRPFTTSGVNELPNSVEDGAEDPLLAYGRECSDAIPASDVRKMTRDFYREHAGGSADGFAGGNGVGATGAQQQRLFRRSHMLTPWEISSAAATFSYISTVTNPIVAASAADDLTLGSGLPQELSKSLQNAYCLQLPQCDAVSLALMFSTCRPNEDRCAPRSGGETDRNRSFLRAQKQFFSFLRLTEERVVFHSSKFSFAELVDVLGAYLEVHAALGAVHNSLCERARGAVQHKSEREIGAAKSRLAANAMVIDALVESALLHVDNRTSGELGDSRIVISMLASISVHVFSPDIVTDQREAAERVSGRDYSHLKPLTQQALWFRQFPQLQRVIHALGAVVIADSRQYTVHDVLAVLQIGVRMGDSMLDAAVTAVLHRLNQLVEMEHFEITPRSGPEETTVTIPSIIPLSTMPSSTSTPSRSSPIEDEVARRAWQRSQAIGAVSEDTATLLSHGGLGQFEVTPQIKERLAFAASVAARNHASELFAVLEELCSFTERRLEADRRRKAALSGLEERCSPKDALAFSEFGGLRPRQIEFIQRLLLPALRKASLA